MNMNQYQNYREDKTHTSSEFPYNTYLCSIPLDFIHVPLHWHNELELIVIKKGSGIVSVDFCRKTVSSGDIIFILPGQLHSISQKPDCSMEYENILLDPSMLTAGENDLCATQYILPLMEGQMASDIFLTPVLPYYQDAANCISAIDRLCDIRPEGYQLGIKGWLFQLVFLLILNQKNRDSVSGSRTKSLQKLKTILKYVEEHYDETITVDEMAALAYYSKSHFMKFFKSHMGMGFIEYLNDYRLTIAARLLTTTDNNILEVASQVGFDNLSYFNRLFKRKFHDTPGHYRSSSQR